MLSKKHRLNIKLIPNFYQFFEVYQSQHLRFYYFNQENLQLNEHNQRDLTLLKQDVCSKLGVIISKKKIASAVQRNKVKRQIYHIFKQDKIHLTQNWLIIVSVTRAVGLNYTELKKQIHYFITQSLHKQ